MRGKILLVIIISLLFCSCKHSINNYETFLPNEETLKKGVVNKYYITTYFKNGKNPKMDIEYSYFKMINDSTYINRKFNPAFKMTSATQLLIRDSVIKEINQKLFYRQDSIRATYPDNNQTDYFLFGKDTAYHKAKLSVNDTVYYNLQESFYLVKDTLIDSKSAKITQRNKKMITYYSGIAKDTINIKIRSIYVKGLGMWSSTSENSYSKNEFVLMEQLSTEHFDKLASHKIERVGFIDFDTTIDKDTNLELCFSHDQIKDYYNGQENRSGFIGGKRGLKKYVNSKLDAKKLKKESGYLTFRFVINCKGKAGKFITNQADFEYTEKQFSQETITHLYEILSSVEKWKPCIIRGKKRDSYFYITFILKDGKIQDLLP